MSSPHAFEIPPAVLAALRSYLGQAKIDAVLSTAGPLSAADRQALEDGLRWWQEQHATARDRVRAITARLADARSQEPPGAAGPGQRQESRRAARP